MINLTVSEAIYLYSVYDELVSAATAHPIPDRVSFAGARTELHMLAALHGTAAEPAAKRQRTEETL